MSIISNFHLQLRPPVSHLSCTVSTYWLVSWLCFAPLRISKALQAIKESMSSTSGGKRIAVGFTDLVGVLLNTKLHNVCLV